MAHSGRWSFAADLACHRGDAPQHRGYRPKILVARMSSGQRGRAHLLSVMVALALFVVGAGVVQACVVSPDGGIRITPPSGWPQASVMDSRTAEQSESTPTLSTTESELTHATPLAPGYFNVTFSQTGLPKGTLWWVSLGQSTTYSAAARVVFQVQNGSYPYTVGPVNGYVLSQAMSGTIHVANSSVSHALTFSPIPTFSLTFDETGLPKNTFWSLILNGSTVFTSSSSISVSLPNGTYHFGIPSAQSYTPSPSTGSIKLLGVNVTESIAFAEPTVLGFPPAEGFFAVTIGVIAILLLSGIAFALVRRRIRHASALHEQPSQPPVTSSSAAAPTSSAPPTPPKIG